MNGTATADIRQIATASIVAGDNDRQSFDARALAELAESIRLNGLASPPLLRPLAGGRFQIVAGERRVRAMRDVLGWGHVPAIVRELSDEEAAAFMLAENTARCDLDPFDEADAYAKRLATGLTREVLAAQAGRSVDTIARRLRLRGACDELRQAVRLRLVPLWAAEACEGLDGDHQRQAVKIWQGTPRMIERELFELVARLRADQDQGAFFTLAAEEWAAEVVAARAERREPMGQVEIADFLGVQVNTVHQWRKRGVLPAPDFTISGIPAWWSESVHAWASSTGRLAF